MSRVDEAFAGGVAVITGAGSGIGAGLAQYAAGLGMKVVLADVVKERVEALAQVIRDEGGEALAVATDVSKYDELERLAAVTHEHFGDVRLLVNNAGIEILGYSWELDAATWEKVLNVNIHGVIHGVRAFAPRMVANGQRSWIANVSSIGGLGIMPIQTSYVLSKHAVLSFSECLYLEMQLKQAPVQVSAVLPGPVATRIFTDSPETGDGLVAGHRAVMVDMLKQAGISPIEAAERIFAQLAEGKFWVSTHPEMTQQMAAQRAQHLAGLMTPELPESARALLKE